MRDLDVRLVETDTHYRAEVFRTGINRKHVRLAFRGAVPDFALGRLASNLRALADRCDDMANEHLAAEDAK